MSEAEFRNYEVKFGDILFQRSSETREEVGQSNVYLDENATATFGGFVIRGTAKQSYDPAFFHYLLKTASVRRDITSRSGGSTRYNIGQESLRNVRIFLPTQSEQKKIAAFLSAVDGKVRELARKKDLLLEYKEGVMQKIFNQRVRFKDDNCNDFPSWNEISLNKFLIPTLREIATPSQPYLAVGVRSHFKGTFQKPNADPQKIDMEKLYVVHAGDLIVNITFAWEGAMAIAKKNDDGGLVSHRFPTYTFNEEVTTSEFFKYIYSNARFKHFLKLISPGGAGRNRVLNKKDFLALKVSLPSMSEQIKISRFLQALDLKIDSVRLRLEKTKDFRRGLLQQMFV